MELIQGRTLEAELAERGPFRRRRLPAFGVELCRALAAVHRAGLVHRDVKAQNVLHETGGRIVLGDFGTGHELHDDADSTAVAGTPAYLAPEVFQHAPATPQRDVYSLGALLFHLATGSYPISGRTIREIRESHAKGARAKLRDARPDLPDPLITAVDTALDPDPTRRFPDAASMEAALALILPDGSIRSRRRGSRLWTLAIGVSIAAAGGASSGSVRLPVRIGVVAGSDRRGIEASRNFRQISPDSGLAGPGGPSPDGRLLSFVDEWGDLAIHDIATGKRWSLTRNRASQKRTGDAETSRFTADGTTLLYVWYPLTETESVGGRTAHRAPQHPHSGRRVTTPLERNRQQRAGIETLVGRRWNDPGQRMASGTALATRGRRLGDINDPRDPSHRTTSPNGASLSPDAVHIVFDKPDPATRLRDIYLARVGEAQEVPLIRDESSDHSPMWTRDGRFVLFLSDRSGPTSLWAQRVEGARPVGRPIRVEPNLGWASPMGETAEGAYFFRRQMGTRDVYIVDLDQNGVIASEPMRASSEVVGANGSSDWSPDGKQLTFFRRRDDRWSLVVKSIAEPREREINHPNLVGIGRPRWEPGGTSILFKSTYQDRPGLQRVDLQTGEISTVIPKFIGHYNLIPHSRELIYEINRRRSSDYDLASGVSTLVHSVDRPGLRPAWRSRQRAIAWPTPRATRGLKVVSAYGSSIWRAPGASARSFVRG